MSWWEGKYNERRIKKGNEKNYVGCTICGCDGKKRIGRMLQGQRYRLVFIRISDGSRHLP